mmetsp:Transcript_27650/g.23240  ORF Transcript_27650/g.23240 Transcript_27650/m.23240 type:complete len:89 (+) Transcript_27650:212-478(+)
MGKLVCWGCNRFRQSEVPQFFFKSDTVQVSAGATHTCALNSQGSVMCWGRLNKVKDRPVSTSLSRNVNSIASGDSFVCAVTDDQSLTC